MVKRYLRRWRREHGRFGGLPTRLRLHAQFATHEATFKWPLHGNVLGMLRERRLHLGREVLLYEHVQILGHPDARISIGEGTFLNRDVAVVAIDRVDIGAHCLFAHGCFIADNDHRIDDHSRPVGDQGLTSKGPVQIGDHVWCGANVVVTSGVTIGERCVIGANSVVTHDIPPYSIAVGAPARVVGVNRPATVADRSTASPESSLLGPV